MKLLIGQTETVAAWVAAHIDGVDSAEVFGPCCGIGVVDDAGEMLGGVVYFKWQPHFKNIEIAAASASRRWLTKSVAKTIISYPFTDLGCERITALTPRSARPARRFLENFGFRIEGNVRHGFGDDSIIIYGMLRREWAALPWGGLDEQKRLDASPDAGRSHRRRRRANSVQ